MMDGILGPLVLLVLTPFDGDPEQFWLPVVLALLGLSAACYDEDIYSARIVADDVNMRDWGG
jgi:hypothetical protein